MSFTVDPTQSYFHIVNITDDPSPTAPLQESTVLGVDLIPQVAGAATDALSGTVVGDLTAGVFTFNGSSNISLNANPVGPFAPSSDPGTDNYGVVTNGNTALGVPISIVVRNDAFTIESGSVAIGSPADTLTLETTAGYQVNSFNGQASLVGQSGPDSSTADVTLTTVGNIETLIIPVIRLPAGGTPGQLYVTGEIVATATVPEASSITFATIGLGSVALAWIRRNRESKLKS